MSDIKQNGYYVEKKLEGWTFESPDDQVPKKVPSGQFIGRNYRVYTQKVHHEGFGWKFRKKIIVFLANLFTLGMAAKFSSHVKSLKAQAKTGDEIKRIKVLVPENTSTENNETSGEQLAQQPNNPEANPSKTTKQPDSKDTGPAPKTNPHTSANLLAIDTLNTQKVTVPVQPQPKSLGPVQTPVQPVASRKFQSILTKIDPKEKLTFPSIFSIEPKDKRLNEKANILIEEQAKTEPAGEQDDRLNMFFPARKNPFQVVMSRNLVEWHQISRQNFTSRLGLKDDDIDPLDERINERLELLDSSFDIKKRLSACKNQNRVRDIQIQDIEAPWAESGLKIVLATAEELGGMSYDTLIHLTPRQKELLEKRLKKVKPLADFKKEITEQNFESLTLTELRSLPDTVLDRFIPKLLPELLPLLTETQGDGLDISKLSDEQFKVIYQSPRRLQKLIQPRLNDCLSRLKALLPKQFVYLTDTQIKSIDFKNVDLIDKESFCQMASINSHDEKQRGRGIHSLDKNQVIDCLNRGLFTPATIRHITKDQINENDFSQINLEATNAKSIISQMFRYAHSNMYNGDKIFYDPAKIKILDSKSLKFLLPHLDSEIFASLSDKQIQEFDFTDVNFTQAMFEELAELNRVNDGDRGRGIGRLSQKQVNDCLNRGLFTPATIRHITKDQINENDFSQINLEATNAKSIISQMFRYAHSNMHNGDKIFYDPAKIKILDSKSLKFLLPHLDSEIFASLSDKQIQEFDFTDVNFTQAMFEELAELNHVNDGDRGRGIGRLSQKQVNDCLNRGLFTPATIRHITKDQINENDFSQINLEATNAKSIISQMFRYAHSNMHNGGKIFYDPAKIKILDSKSLKFLLPHLASEIFSFLSDKQIQEFDFTDVNFTQAMFEELAELNHVNDGDRGRGIGRLSQKQVNDCLNRGLFTPPTIRHITKDQINENDFSQINLEATNAKSIISQMFRYAHSNMHNGGKIFYDPAKIKILDSKSLKFLLPHLASEIFSFLSDKQIQEFDFTDVNFTQAMFEELAELNHVNDGDRGRGIGRLSQKQVNDCLNRGLFTPATIRHITKDQIKENDFSQINLEATNAKSIISQMFRYAHSNTYNGGKIFYDPAKIQALDSKSLQYLLPHFASEIFASLSATQIQEFDFTDVNFTQAMFEELVQLNHSDDNLRGRGIDRLASEHVMDCLVRGFFTLRTVSYLKMSQINLMDQAKLESLSSTPVIAKIIERKKTGR